MVVQILEPAFDNPQANAQSAANARRNVARRRARFPAACSLQ
jgi:hypothetical protein